MKKLYFIQNVGCDDTTELLTEIDEGDVSMYIELFKKMNENSFYGCQPTVWMGEIELISREECLSHEDEEVFVDKKVFYRIEDKNEKEIYFKVVKDLMPDEFRR